MESLISYFFSVKQAGASRDSSLHAEKKHVQHDFWTWTIQGVPCLEAYRLDGPGRFGFVYINHLITEMA